MRVQSLGQKTLLEQEMATHPSILAWETPRTEEPGRLQSMGSQSQARLSSSAQQSTKVAKTRRTLLSVSIDRYRDRRARFVQDLAPCRCPIDGR